MKQKLEKYIDRIDYLHAATFTGMVLWFISLFFGYSENLILTNISLSVLTFILTVICDKVMGENYYRAKDILIYRYWCKE